MGGMRLASSLLVISAMALGAPAARATSVPPPPSADPTRPATYRFASGEAPARLVRLDLPPAPIDVWLPGTLDAATGDRLAASVAKHLAELPAEHRAALHTVAFDPGEFPGNARKAQQLQQPELKLWASARAGAIAFYRNTPPGDWRVTRRRVFHEMGHCLAHVKFGTSSPPPAWAEAARADARFFSTYSKTAFEATGTLVEDFADAYATFMQAQVDGGAPLARFQAAYPARARLLARWTATAGPAATPLPSP